METSGKDLNNLFRLIREKSGHYAAFLQDLCDIESKSDDKEGVDRVCEEILKEGRGHGYAERVMTHPAAGNVASLTLNPDGTGAPVCLSAHTDTVFRRGAFGYPPTRRDGNLLRGPGVMDCKGGIAVALLVMDALKSYGFTDRPVKFILQSEEEIQWRLSGGTTLDYLRSEAAGAAAFFNLEGREKGKITTRRKGILRAEIKVRGRAAHAGDYFEGASAVRAAAYLIIALESKSVRDGVTYNCGIVEGGTAMNVIPDECSIWIDVRVRSEAEAEAAMAVLKDAAANTEVPGTSASVRLISSRIPMERTEGNVRLFRHVDDVCRRYGFGPMEENGSNGGSDAAYATQMGIPTVDDLGAIGDNYHSLDEWCSLDSIAESAAIIAASIVTLPW
ncbi:MAG: M20/M25/M40 family metallo-hydrolase [Clostridia bacterium]|nr:M20/M25/M40 family metallo-hydrolase [Clostridia bacterium]